MWLQEKKFEIFMGLLSLMLLRLVRVFSLLASYFVVVQSESLLLILAYLYSKQGTAMASLVHMQKILANRAQHFPSIEKAVC